MEEKKRSIIKTISWRIIATTTTALLVYLFTGTILLAITVRGTESIAKLIIYYGHERVWNKIRWGMSQ